MTFRDIVLQRIVPFADLLVQVMYAVAFFFFIFGMYKLFFTGGEENRTKGKQFATWSVIGFVILFSVWGIVRLLLASLFP